MKWPSKDEIDGETEHLGQLVDNGWAWQWPGWKWVADRLNEDHHNARSADACKAKYGRTFCYLPTEQVPTTGEGE